jgi:hypothetical protein
MFAGKLKLRFLGLRRIGLRWGLGISTYVGIGSLIIGVNNGYWNQYLAPNIPLVASYTTFGAGLEAGIVGCVFSWFAILFYINEVIGRNLLAANASAHLHGLVVALIVGGIGCAEVLIVPGMLNIYYFGFFMFLSALTALATYLHLQNIPDRYVKNLTELAVAELKLAHAEALELFRTLAQTSLVLVTGVILYALIPRYQGQPPYPSGSIEELSSFKGLLFTLFEIAYGVIGYVLFCIGSVIKKLQLIRTQLRGLGKFSRKSRT